MVPLAIFQPKIARPVNYHVGDVHGLVLCVGGSSDFGEIKKLFDRVKDGNDQISRMVHHLLDDVFALK